MNNSKKKKEKEWSVEATRYISNKDCPARYRKGKIYWCDELDKKCSEKICIGCWV